MNTRPIVVPLLLAGVLTGCGPSKEELSTLQAENTRLAASNHDLSDQIAALKKAADSRDAAEALDLASTRKKVAELTSQLDDAIASVASRQALCDKATAELADSQKQLVQVTDALRQTTAQANAAAEQSKAEIDSLKARVSELQKRLDKALEKAGDDALKRLLPP